MNGMIKQSMGFNDITEKKYKILKTSLMLGSQEDRDELLRNFTLCKRAPLRGVG